MKYTKLGNTDMTISKAGYGCMGLTHAFGKAMADEEAIAKIQYAYKVGYRLFDTAECYVGTYEDGTTAYNEVVVGKAIKPFRDDIVLASKFGVSFGEYKLITDSRPETIRESLEGSLKRLDTDHIDLYYQHRIDPKVEPEVVANTMKELIAEGKIKAWGISEVNPEDVDYLRRAHAVCPVSAVENMYSLIDRYTEQIFPVLEELGITMVAYTPLAKGFLSGNFITKPNFDDPEDGRAFRLQFQEEGIKYYRQALDIIEDLAKKKNATLAQISLAWMMCKHEWIVPIPGTRNESRIEENANASDIVLTKDEIHSIDNSLNKLNLTDTASQ